MSMDMDQPPAPPDLRESILSHMNPVLQRHNNQWMCDFCKKALFDDYKEAAEHEWDCEKRAVTVELLSKRGKTTGLDVLIAKEKEEGKGAPYITFSENSPVVQYVNKIHAAIHALLCPDLEFSYTQWVRLLTGKGEGVFRALEDFGRKNLGHTTLANGISAHALCDESVRAVLSGGLLPGDAIRQVKLKKRKRGSTWKTLNLYNENRFSEEDVGNLSKLFSERGRCSIKITAKRVSPTRSIKMAENPLLHLGQLDMSNNSIVHEDNCSKMLSELIKLSSLSDLKLDGNRIQKNGCAALAKLLRKEGSLLVSLSLRKNRVDDECLRILADALRTNKKLQMLFLNENDSITMTGWDCLLNLVCDPTSIKDTCISNHTLRAIRWSNSQLPSLSRSKCGHELMEMLGFNDCHNKSAVASKKVWKVHFGEFPFDLCPLLDLNVAAMPRAIAWLAIERDLPKLYHLIRNWNLPMLFGFPSAERLRIGSRVVELEALVEKLTAEKAAVAEEVGTLRRENESLRGKTKQPGDSPVSFSKRRKAICSAGDSL